jgi:DnaJ-class molecular chaperone
VCVRYQMHETYVVRVLVDVQAAKRWHPDLHRDSPMARDRFDRSLLAYQILSQAGARKCYDISQDRARPHALRAATRAMALRSASIVSCSAIVG